MEALRKTINYHDIPQADKYFKTNASQSVTAAAPVPSAIYEETEQLHKTAETRSTSASQSSYRGCNPLDLEFVYRTVGLVKGTGAAHFERTSWFSVVPASSCWSNISLCHDHFITVDSISLLIIQSFGGIQSELLTVMLNESKMK